MFILWGITHLWNVIFKHFEHKSDNYIKTLTSKEFKSEQIFTLKSCKLS